MVLGISILLAAFFFAGGLVIGRRSVTAKLEETRSVRAPRDTEEARNQGAVVALPDTKQTLSPAPTEVYTVRVASAAEMDQALSVAEKLHQLSYVRVALVVPPSSSVSRNILVEVGPFADKKRAESTVRDLKEQGFEQAEVFAK